MATALAQLASIDDRLRPGVSPGATVKTGTSLLSAEIVAVEEDVPGDVAQLGIVRWARYEAIDEPVTGVIGETADGSTYHLKRRNDDLLATPADIEIPKTEEVAG